MISPQYFYNPPHTIFWRALQFGLIKDSVALFFCVIEFRQKNQRRPALLRESATMNGLGAPVEDACKKIEIYEPAFYNWKTNRFGLDHLNFEAFAQLLHESAMLSQALPQ